MLVRSSPSEQPNYDVPASMPTSSGHAALGNDLKIALIETLG